MKYLKYYLSFLCFVLLLALPCVFIFLIVTENTAFIELLSSHIPVVAFVVVAWFALFKAANAWFERAKYNKNVDAFGMTNKLDYSHLSDKERKEYDRQRKAEMNRILSDSAIRQATHSGSLKPEEEMQHLSGMEDVKEKVNEIVARANYDRRHGKKENGFSSHYVFYGAPGTGKTTFARILTGMLYKNRIIKRNICIEVDGNLLKASAPGEGALKAELLVKNAFGGVLFIDEAYSMAEGYGNEAVDTLIKLMEDMRGKFVLILAGYTEPMRELINSNPGFRSRIKDYIEFPDYTVDEAEHIFRTMAKQEGFSVTDDGIVNFRTRYLSEILRPDFGNARTVRNILDEAISSHALKLTRDRKVKRHVLTADDIRDTPRQTL